MTDTEKNSTMLGPWADDDLVRTARLMTSLGADADLPDDVRFIKGVARIVRRRLVEDEAKSDPARPAVFLLNPNVSGQRSDIKPKRVPMLSNGRTSVNGRLWFVSPAPVMGHYIDLDKCDDDDELFRIVTDDLKLGGIPTVVFDPRTKIPEIRFYAKGLIDPDICQTAQLNQSDVSVERIFEVIHRVYQASFVTPDAQPKAGKLWQESAKYWPVENAEDRVQLYLQIGLASAFLTCTVRHEQPSIPGRTDLEIEESAPLDSTQIIRHAVLELKVLRSFGSTGIPVSEQETRDWIEKGIRQAATYRIDKNAKASALCCFDMRCVNTDEKCFDHVADLSGQLVVALRRWFIYASSEQYREAVTTPTYNPQAMQQSS
jgi:hypothetical protein